MTIAVIGAVVMLASVQAAPVSVPPGTAPSVKASMAMVGKGAGPACPATPAPLPAAYAGWTAAAPIAAGRDAATPVALPLGKGARLALSDAAAVRWATTPGHAPTPGTRGGIVALNVAAAGRYRVALSAGAWIDMVRDGAAVASVAHAHGPVCTTIRKTVDFDLTPGRYLIQLSGTAAPAVDVMALRVAA